MNADRLLAHYEQIADAPDAITRLRRFILDLAVRGKLVPQDPKDEPASELLQRIAEEKTRLVKAREIRREEPLTEIDTSAFPMERPDGWVLTRLATISRRIHYGYTASADTAVKDIRMLRITDIQQNAVDWPSVPGCFMDPGTVEQYKLQKGDILIARTGGTIGKTFLVGDVPITAVFASYLIRVQGTSHVFDQFLKLFLESSLYWTQLRDGTRGTGQPNVNGQTLGKLVLPLPPLAEQRRVVAKVDELMALCDRLEAARTARETTRDRLAAASLARLNAPNPETFDDDARFALHALPALTARRDQIKQLRQTIVNLAVRGKLVPQDPSDEPAAELLKRVARERNAPQTNNARRNGEAEISSRQADVSLPSGWQWTNIDQIALSMRYGTSTKCEHAASGVPVLRIPNVSGGFITLDDMKFGPLTESEARDLALRTGDLLMIRSNGSLNIVGRSAVVTAEAEGMAFAGYLVRLRSSLSNLNPKYVWLALNSTDVRDQIERPIRSAVGLKNVNLTEFGALTFPLPPLAEQHRIVAKVDDLMALCDRLEASLATASATRLRLLDALLAEALAPADARELEAAE